jgi:hypothetical protein
VNLLVYGGCHALILKRLIDELGPQGRHHVTLLINFQVVASGKPFPYEKLRDYDVVIYSPIQNKGDYNTSFLEEACEECGVPTICFPWLEWHGHSPGADKDWFWGHHGWYFPALVELSREFWDCSAFSRFVRAEYPSQEAIQTYFADTTRRLKEQEQAFDCQVKISDFVLDNYHDRRMFLTPDHPTLVLYRYVVNEIENLVGTRLVASWPSDLPELQPEERTPILPRIAAETQLTFADTTWRSETQPLVTMDLDGFLALHFQAGRRALSQGEGVETVLATAARPTWVGSPRHSAADEGPVAVPIFTQVLMRRAAPTAGQAYFDGEILATLTDHPPLDAVPRSVDGWCRFRSDDWTFRS